MQTNKTCPVCQTLGHSKFYCKSRPRKPIKVNSYLPRPKKRIKQQSVKEQAYQVWKETVARSYIIARDSNSCQCCHRPAHEGEKLDIDHINGKGSTPSQKRDLTNLRLLCRWPCHRNRTDGIPCLHL